MAQRPSVGSYGFTVAYRYTKEQRYLDMADKIYRYIFTHENLPPTWFPTGTTTHPTSPTSRADAGRAVAASALYELVDYDRPEYRETADKIMTSLAGDAYTAIVGTNGNFLLMHSVGSIPHDNEIDVPLNYTDYYFLEALTRKMRLEGAL